MFRLCLALLPLACAGCVKSMAVHAVADALAGQGDVFARDDDPQLVREAIPFGLKTYESVLEAAPEHRGLLLATGSGFIQYAYAFVAQDADAVDADDVRKARQLRARAKKLFLRGRDYVLRALELDHPGFAEGLRKDPEGTLARTTAPDAPALYWAGTGWTAALMVEKGDLGLIADLPLGASLVRRSAALDPSYNQGAAHEILISYEGSRPEAMGGSAAKAREHYAKALELSGGRRASVHLALAESVAVREQNLKEFKALLEKALAVDPNADPSQRLVNLLSRERALRLKSRIPDLFLEAEEENP
ncbi:MAG TPA: TRAP transporter TatT component family protein [Planctomycetota bacterium]|nr:TRAP transporter TatT component family protein [Planctomycetota bacterium]